MILPSIDGPRRARSQHEGLGVTDRDTILILHLPPSLSLPPSAGIARRSRRSRIIGPAKAPFAACGRGVRVFVMWRTRARSLPIVATPGCAVIVFRKTGWREPARPAVYLGDLVEAQQGASGSDYEGAIVVAGRGDMPGLGGRAATRSRSTVKPHTPAQGQSGRIPIARPLASSVEHPAKPQGSPLARRNRCGFPESVVSATEQ